MARRRARTAAIEGIDELLAAKEMVLVCGSGGVGKTTVAAALGAQAAIELGGRVLVLTVDPAKRLASAMGLAAFGNAETRVSLEHLVGPDRPVRGELWAAMLDTKAGWDELIHRHAPDPATRDAVLANPLYQNITGRFVNSHDYIAMERLHEVHASGTYDLVIVDTPPSRNALDLLDAPARMAEFFGSRLLRWLTVPYRSRVLTLASKPFYQIADRVLGSHFLADIAEFFSLFQRMEAGFVERAQEVERLLSDPRSTFVVVSTLEAAPAAEARYFVDELDRRGLPLGAVVLNRVLPDAIRSPGAARSARALAAALDDRLAATVGEVAAVDPAAVGRILGEVAARFHDVAVVAKGEAERRSELAALAPLVASAPTLPSDVHDLEGLLMLGDHLWRS
jgi:anion-transporting  ArsA/GET3 family ATPase